MRKRGTTFAESQEVVLRKKDLFSGRAKVVVYPAVIEPVAKLKHGSLRRIYAIAKKLEA